jgi:ribonuclease VapC
VILDSSAAVAILLREPGHDELVDALAGADSAAVGGPTLTETGVVLAARIGAAAVSLVARFVQEGELEVIAFGSEHWPVAVDAYRRFGRGRHPAKLNFGDCLTYAVARLAAEPLLCVGDEFAKTDLELARGT